MELDSAFCMCSWLGPDYEQDLWIPNHNKIPLSSDAEYARELFGRTKQRLQFHSALGQAMLATARTSGGYVKHISWFSKWDMEWTELAHPGRSLQAARLSRFPPQEDELYRWCNLYFPSWVPHFWPRGRHQRVPSFDLNSMD